MPGCSAWRACSSLLPQHRQTALDVALAKANRYGAALLLAYGTRPVVITPSRSALRHRSAVTASPVTSPRLASAGSPLPSDPQRAVEPGLLGFALQVAERRAGRLTAGRVAEEQRRVAAWLAGGEGVETSKAAGESSSETSANGGGGGACGGGGASSSSHGDDDAGAASSGDVGSGGGAASPRSPEAKWREAFADADAAEWGGGAAAAWGWECPLGPRCPMLRHRGQGQSSSASCSTSGRAPGGCGGRRCDSPRARFAAALRGVLSAGPNRDPAGAAGAARALAGFAAAARAGAFDEAAKALRAAVGEQPWGEASGAEQKAALIAVLRCVAAVEAERRARDADAVATAAAAAARAAAGGVLARLRAAHLRLPAADEGERGRSSRGNAEEELGGDPPQQHHHRMDAAAGAAAGDDSAQDDGGSSAAAPQAS